MITLLIFSIIGNNAFCSEVVELDVGSPAPFRGYLFPPDKALDLKKQLIELDNLKTLELSYQKSIDLYKNNEELYNHKINLLLDQNNKLVDSLSKTQQQDKWENRLWFILGIAVTSVAVYGAGRLK